MGSRRYWLAGVVSLVLLTALASGLVLLLRQPTSGNGSTSIEYPLAQVQRRTLTVSASLDGTLGYGSAHPIPILATGFVTWLPESGTTITRGQTLEKVDNRPVVLMYGVTPAYRAIGAAAGPASDTTSGAGLGADEEDPASNSTTDGIGRSHVPSSDRSIGSPSQMTPGPDVEELKQNLHALGYTGFTVDDTFTGGTAAAVRAWQADIGLPVTGVVNLGDVVFLPKPVRAVVNPEALGTQDAATAVEATSTTKVVSVTAPAGSLDWATPGAPVKVTLPDQKQTAGAVAGIGSRTSTATSDGDPGGADVSVTITLKRPGQVQQTGSVTVTYVSRRAKNVLTVPVTALVALAEGGYALQLADGSYAPVTPGIYADGLVEISVGVGSPVAAGVSIRNAT